ncbi:copper-transporting ATPase, partial [Pseudomonas sp. Choline-3u-10]
MTSSHCHHQPDQTKGSAPLTDPVCGMKVKENSEHEQDYQGTTYRFCSQGCRTKFRSDPARYLAAQQAHGSSPQASTPPAQKASAGDATT